MQQYPYDIPTEAFPFEIFKQAFVAVQSCVVHLQVGGILRNLIGSLLTGQLPVSFLLYLIENFGVLVYFVIRKLVWPEDLL